MNMGLRLFRLKPVGLNGFAVVGCGTIAAWVNHGYCFKGRELVSASVLEARNAVMTPLRSKMIEDMRTAGLAPSTQAVYLQGVRALAAHYRRSPDLLGEEEVRSYLLHLRERGAALGTFKPHHGGIQFLFCRTLDREWSLFSKKESIHLSASVCPSCSRMPKFERSLGVSEILSTGPGSSSCTHAVCVSVRLRRLKSQRSIRSICLFASSARATRSARSQFQRRFLMNCAVFG
jgi:Phage integrase, N-terminal SAM-like domain